MRAERDLEQIPVFAPAIGPDTLEHLKAALDAGWLGMGAITKEFEDRIAAFLGLKERYPVATNTGTSALHMALVAAGIGAGDEVITPSFNYVSDQQAIVMAGASVVMCDVRDDTLGIDCDAAAKLISNRTKALMPLHFAGIPCDRSGVYRLAREHGLRVIEDCSHAFGTTVANSSGDILKLGADGDIAMFSFDPVKVATSIDGGCAIFPTEEERERARHARFLGVDKETAERYKNRRSWEYDVVSRGFRYHLTNINASVGISQLERVAAFIDSRRSVCRAYSAAFEGLPGLRTPATDFANVSPFIYSLRVTNGRRDDLIEHLRARAVGAGIHFIPAHKFSFFAGARRGPMPVTERAAGEVVTLPLHSSMKAEHIERVIAGVREWAAR